MPTRLAPSGASVLIDQMDPTAVGTDSRPPIISPMDPTAPPVAIEPTSGSTLIDPGSFLTVTGGDLMC
jgi:hypothetical protein